MGRAALYGGLRKDDARSAARSLISGKRVAPAPSERTVRRRNAEQKKLAEGDVVELVEQVEVLSEAEVEEVIEEVVVPVIYEPVVVPVAETSFFGPKCIYYGYTEHVLSCLFFSLQGGLGVYD
jgi:hypothetical protein